MASHRGKERERATEQETEREDSENEDRDRAATATPEAVSVFLSALRTHDKKHCRSLQKSETC